LPDDHSRRLAIADASFGLVCPKRSLVLSQHACIARGAHSKSQLFTVEPNDFTTPTAFHGRLASCASCSSSDKVSSMSISVMIPSSQVQGWSVNATLVRLCYATVTSDLKDT
jgi:hypothetical protein